jgi:hypothetical protein
MSKNRARFLVLMYLCLFIGFIWPNIIPNCDLRMSFLIPWVFCSGGVGANIMVGSSTKDKWGGSGEVPILLIFWLLGWGALVFSGVPVAIGWFLGAMVCINVLPVIGIYACTSCLL